MSKLVLTSLMDPQDALSLIRREARHPRMVSIVLHRIQLDNTMGQALLGLLHLHRHRSYETLELLDCAKTPVLEELLRYVYHAQLFKHISMQAVATSASATGSAASPSTVPPLPPPGSYSPPASPVIGINSANNNAWWGAVRIAPPTSRFHFALQRFTLSHMYVSIRNAVRLRKSLEATKQLTMLELDCVQFERCAICQIAQGVESNTTLRTLNCHFTSSVDAYVMMHSVQAHSSLKEIHFQGDCVSDSGSIFLGKGMNDEHCPLETLRLTGLGGIFDLAPMISEIYTTAQISALDLSDNFLQNYQIDYLFSHLHKFPKLTKLNLSRNQLSDFGEAILVHPDVLSTSLTSLDLTYNRLTDQGADEFLTHLWKFPALRDLNLSRNRLHLLEFTNFLRLHSNGDSLDGGEPVQTYGLRQLSLFHPHFALLDPGEAVFHHGWTNNTHCSFTSRLLTLLKRTPQHLKIGSFWAVLDIETQHLLDVRQVSVADDPTRAPIGLWPHVLAQANQLFEGKDGSRLAAAIFHLVHQGAPCFLEASSSSSSQPPAEASPERWSPAQDEVVNPIRGERENSYSRNAVKANAMRKLSPLEQEIIMNSNEASKEPSSEFMTCSMQESEATADQSYRVNQNGDDRGHRTYDHRNRQHERRRRYKRLLRFFRITS